MLHFKELVPKMAYRFNPCSGQYLKTWLFLFSAKKEITPRRYFFRFYIKKGKITKQK